MTRFQSTDATTLRAVMDGMKKPDPILWWKAKADDFAVRAFMADRAGKSMRKIISDLGPNPRKPELIAAIKSIKEVLG